MTIRGLRGHLVTEAFLSSQISCGTPATGWPASLGDALRHVGPATSPRALIELIAVPLLRSLGFERVEISSGDGTLFVCEATSKASVVPVIVAPWNERLDALWRAAVLEARRRRARWCIVLNGAQIRIVDPNRLYGRRFAEIDLVHAADRPDCLSTLLRLASAPALCAPRTDPASLEAIVGASDTHAAGVRRSLREGVLSASSALLRALTSGERRLDQHAAAAAFEQALTIVYRILFLLFAEARSLVPVWHAVYRESYTIDSLREQGERSADAPGCWDALRAIARLAHAGCRAGDLTVTPFNGRLFAPARAPLADRRDLDDRAARDAILALSTRPAADRTGRERIVYRDLGVEQLGAVYETLLDYRPRIGPPSRGDARRDASPVTLEIRRGLRKQTATFYTPLPLADYVVRRTLAPLVAAAEPSDILELRIVDPAMGSGAFLVAACRYLASAYEEALIRRGDCHPGDIDDAENARIRRSIAERCLYGVDLNPMAVQLARLSVWLATLAADRPLSFLDHRLVVGDSVVGAWLTSLRRPPRRRTSGSNSTLPLFNDRATEEALRDALPVRFSLETTPNDTPAQIRSKERALAALAARSRLSCWKRVADLWCAAWFGGDDQRALTAAFAALSDAILGGSGALPAKTAAALLARADRIAGERHFLHWELEFPEVFFDADGRRLPSAGFDAVLGNPPWEMMRADPRNEGLPDARRDLAAAVRFARDAGGYDARSEGHANQYQWFVERAIRLTRPGGRFGLVLPSGLTTDHGSAGLRSLLFQRCDVDAIVGIENRQRVFPIHRSVRFILLSATAGRPTRAIECRLGLESPADLDSLTDDSRQAAASLRVSIDTLVRLSGPSLVIPQLRGTVDLAVCEKAASLFRPLGAEDGWAARFGRELNATEDRDAFHAASGLPVVDGRHLTPYRVSLADVSRRITLADARRRLRDQRFTRPRLAYRDVAGATNRLTLIAAILPADCVSTHTVFCLRSPLPIAEQHLLCGLFNSFVVNYLVRLRVTTHVTTASVEHLPIPTCRDAPGACREIAALARRLARRDDAHARARLNARVAELYQLTRAEFAHVLGTFPLVEHTERDAALAEFWSRV
jgi:N-6 DNA Methylase